MLPTTHRAAMGLFVGRVGPPCLAAEHGRSEMSEHVGRFVGFGVEEEAGPLPYLVERLMPAVYRRRPVPGGLARDDLIAWAGDEAVAAGRGMCLVLGPEECVYLTPDGCWEESAEPPRGGVAVCEDSDGGSQLGDG